MYVRRAMLVRGAAILTLGATTWATTKAAGRPAPGVTAPELRADAPGVGAESGAPAALAKGSTQATQAIDVQAYPSPDQLGGSDWTYFHQTGHYVSGAFKASFETNGGLGALGYPITETLAVDGGTVQYFERARLEWGSGAVQTALIGDEYLEAAGLGNVRGRARPPQLARVDLDGSQERLDVYDTPGGTTRLTRLRPDTLVRLTGEAPGPDGQIWYAVRLWHSLDGFVAPDGLAFTPAPLKGPSPRTVPWKPPRPPAQGPFPLQTQGRMRVDGELAAEPAGQRAGRLAATTVVRVTAWATDRQGRAWYAVATQTDADTSAEIRGWIPTSAIKLDLPDPLTATVGGAPLAQAVAGKGMWFTYDVLRETPVQHLIAAAKANGLTFLAPQVGTSRRGYWAGAELDALLPAAHLAGLKVIPWVYPWLVDLPADVTLAAGAARHVAPGGHHVDGIAVDVEENLDEGAVRAYGQLLRATLGAETLLIALTYQPQNSSGRRTPFNALSESFNVLAPMSYWHLRNIPHTYDDAYAYVAESVRLIRERTGRPDLPIAIVGQTFDWFTRYEIGGGNPTTDEIRGAMQAARDRGALGIGFFNWLTASPDEWEAIGAFPWA